MMIKNFFFFMLFLISLMVYSFSNMLDLMFFFDYLYIDWLTELNFSFFFIFESIFFIMMVFMVFLIICLFSEIYMDNYNIEKYFLIFLFFFLSMISLLSSFSYLMIIFSWDFLGLTSVFLVMFYSNEVSNFNSFFTYFFNRLGDFFLMMSVYYVLMNLENLIFFYKESIFIMMLFCIFTKSAQFPFFSWLPLAMSAPTPISALVHSSTLVTAGVFMIFNIIDYLTDFNMNILILFTLMGFLMGGLLSCSEKDFKKMIAFSTMSQISMMIFFVSLSFKYFCFLHMFYHSMFKSLIFCMAGLGFFFIYMDQSKMSMSFKNFSKYLKIVTFFCIFMMTGLIFSFSFYSKDYLLEWMNSYVGLSYFLILLIGSTITMIYCMMMSFSVINFNSLKKFFYYKEFGKCFFFYFLFSISLNYISLIFMYFYSSFLDYLDLILFNLYMFVIFMFMFKLNNSFYFHYQFLSLFYLETLMYYTYINFISSSNFFFSKKYLSFDLSLTYSNSSIKFY